MLTSIVMQHDAGIEVSVTLLINAFPWMLQVALSALLVLNWRKTRRLGIYHGLRFWIIVSYPFALLVFHLALLLSTTGWLPADVGLGHDMQRLQTSIVFIAAAAFLIWWNNLRQRERKTPPAFHQPSGS